MSLFTAPSHNKTTHDQPRMNSELSVNGSFPTTPDRGALAKEILTKETAPDLKKFNQQVSDFLLDQVIHKGGNQQDRSLTPEQAKLYHQILTSKEFQEALLTKDNTGQTLADTLTQLIQANRNPHLSALAEARNTSVQEIKTEILTSILDKVATNGFTNQGIKNTCVLATVESDAFNQNPAQVSRLVIDLATKGDHRLQRDGQQLDFKLPLKHLAPDPDHAKFAPRNVFEQVFQESSAITLLKAVGGDESTYDSRTTSSSIQNSQGAWVDFSGKFAVQGELLHSMLTGQGHHILDRGTDPQNLINQTRQNLENLQAGQKLNLERTADGFVLSGCDFKQAMTVHLKWAPNGSDHAKHCLQALGIYTNENNEKFVILRNSHYEQGFKPNSVFEINRSAPPHQRLEMMPLADFESRLQEAHIPTDSQIITVAETKQTVQAAIDHIERIPYPVHVGEYLLSVPVNHQDSVIKSYEKEPTLSKPNPEEFSSLDVDGKKQNPENNSEMSLQQRMHLAEKAEKLPKHHQLELDVFGRPTIKSINLMFDVDARDGHILFANRNQKKE